LADGTFSVFVSTPPLCLARPPSLHSLPAWIGLSWHTLTLVGVDAISCEGLCSGGG